jgi:hypothetical protein
MHLTRHQAGTHVPQMATRGESCATIFEGCVLPSDKPSNSCISLQIFGVHVRFLCNYIVTPVVTVKWLLMCSRVDRETHRIHNLGLAHCVCLLVPGPKPIFGGQKSVAGFLVKGVHDNFLGRKMECQGVDRFGVFLLGRIHLPKGYLR